MTDTPKDEAYKRIVEDFPMSVIILNRLGYITYVNKAISKYTGYTQDEILGKHFTKLGFIKAVDIHILVDLFKKVIIGKPIEPIEMRYISKTGREGWGIGYVVILKENGIVSGLQIITEEITARKQLQEKLLNNEEKHKILGEATDEGWLETRLDGTIMSMNQVGAKILGYNVEELVGNNISNVYSNPEQRKELVDIILKEGSVVDYPIDIVRKDGTHIYVAINGTLYENKINKEHHFVTTFRDVTEQTSYLQRLEALLKHAAALSRAETLEEIAEITEETLTGTIGFNRGSMGIVEGNKLDHRFRWGVIGYEDFILDLDGSGITVQTVRSGETQLVADVTKNEHFVNGIGSDVTRSELCVPVKINDRIVAVINIENEKENAFKEVDQKLLEIYAEQVSSALQRLESKRAQQELLERYRGFSDSALESFILLDKDFNIVDMNNEGARRFGLKAEQVIGKNLLDIQPSLEHTARYQQYKEVLKNGKSITVDVFDHPTGIDYLRMQAFKVGEGLGLIASDLSEIKREQEAKAKLNQQLFEQKILAEQLVEMDRMKTNFMNTATHEIRTPITSIKGYSELIELMVHEQTDTELWKYLEAIIRNVNRLEHLSNDLLDIQRIESNRMVINKEEVSIEQLMKAITQEMTPLLLEKTQDLVIEKETKKEYLLCDEMRITQVLINLVNNASYYSPENTTIKVTITDSNEVTLFTIEDHGIGLTPEDIPKLFKPFPDIKARVERGTGLGLSICKGIVELHGGEIWAESAGYGKGSIFHFTIPDM